LQEPLKDAFGEAALVDDTALSVDALLLLL